MSKFSVIEDFVYRW